MFKMFLHKIIGILFNSSSSEYLYISEAFQQNVMFQLGIVIIVVSILFYALVSIFSVRLQTGGIHYVYTKRVALPMQAIHNPFLLEVNLNEASYSGVQCTLYGEKDYYVLALWGVSIYHLFQLLHSDPETMKDSITTFSYKEMLSKVCKSSSNLLFVKGGEKKTMLFSPCFDLTEEVYIKPKEATIRTSYPFVAIMILKDCCSSETLIAMATAVHLPDEKLKLPAHIISQYVKSSSGPISSVRKIFMSSNETLKVNGEDFNLCVACYTRTVSTVILPCGHACVCTTCLKQCKNCPVCRGSSYLYFELKTTPVL